MREVAVTWRNEHPSALARFRMDCCISMLKVSYLFGVTFILGAAFSSASAFDCGRASEPVSRTICDDARTNASDDDVEAAYSSLLKASPGGRTSLLRDQRAWLKRRNGECMGGGVSDAHSCIRERNVRRTAVLTGAPTTGILRRYPHVVIISQAATDSDFEVDLRIYRFGQATDALERSLNDHAAAAIQRAPVGRKEEHLQAAPFHSEIWTLGLATPAFLSITVERGESNGGQSVGWTEGLNLDRRSGRRLSFADLFEDGAANVAIRACVAQLGADLPWPLSWDADWRSPLPDGYGGDASAIEDVRRLATDLNRWSFGSGEAVVHIPSFLPWNRASGTYECRIPLQSLRAHARMSLDPS